MKCMEINKSDFYYALFVKKDDMVDEYGNKTSEQKLTFLDPVLCKANISASVGETIARQFGNDVSYDKVIVMDGDKPVIVEGSRLWIDSVPQLDAEGHLAVDEDGNIKTPHDYIVNKVAKSLNSYSIAIGKVTVSG